MEVYILFFMDDEYGHWDIIGVYSSKEKLDKGWERLSEFTDKKCIERGSTTYQHILLDYDEEKKNLEPGYAMAGEQWFFKKVSVNEELYMRQN
jgi:hypothetical protein